MEACLELMKKESIISIQDMGAAGLTSSSVEMAHKGGLGIELDLDKVPCREENMSPYEMMLSESQERMLIILEDGKEQEAKKIFKKWDLDFVVIGKTTESKNLTLKFNTEVVAKIPIDALSSKAPLYDRKWNKKQLNKKKINLKDLKKIKFDEAFYKIVSSPNHSNKSWVTINRSNGMGDTIERSGTNAAVVKIHNKNKAIAVTVDSSANYCKSHPVSGGKQIVCESWRNLISVGAKPIAITNCLNFGNPENPEIMGEFAENIQGIKEACEFLDYPVVSGNVSFYNGTNNNNIYPTPVIGGVGLIKNLKKIHSHRLKKIDSKLIVIGKTFGHLGQSVYLNELYNLYDGMPPEVNLLNEKNNGEIILKLINLDMVNSVHDVSTGGIILALAEMSISSQIGIKILKPKKLSNLFEYYFGEDQGRYLVEIDQNNFSKIEKILKDNNIYFDTIGVTQKEYFELDKDLKISVKELYDLNNRWYNKYNGFIS